MRSIESPGEDMDTNAGGTLNVLEAMKGVGVSRLVYSSSAAVIGEARGLPVSENELCEPDSPYGVSKLAGEKYCLAYQRLYWWSVACLRYFNVYGVRQRYDAYGNVIPIFADRLSKGADLTIFGDGSQTRDFVDVRDIGRANVDASEQLVSGVFNVATGSRTTIDSLAKAMITASGRSVSLSYAPARKGEVLHSQADISKARAAFGYGPSVELEEGLVDYLDWYLGLQA